MDSGRFCWTTKFHPSIYIIGYLFYISSIAFFSWAMWINKWFSSTVRIQDDRDQQVVQHGPYKIVRHPGYVGGILMGYGQALVFGSLWALIPAGVVMLLFVVRTYLEDKTLQNELDGYTEYTKKTRYRLIPFIW